MKKRIAAIKYGLRVSFRPERVLFRPGDVNLRAYLAERRFRVRLRATPRFPCQNEKYLLSEQKPRRAWSSHPEFPDGHELAMS